MSAKRFDLRFLDTTHAAGRLQGNHPSGKYAEPDSKKTGEPFYRLSRFVFTRNIRLYSLAKNAHTAIPVLRTTAVEVPAATPASSFGERER